MRRFFAVVRKPVIWLPIVFLAAVWYFRAEAFPSPQFTVRTGAAYHTADIGTSNLLNTWSNVLDVSDDGSRITISVQHSEGISFKAPVDTRLERWDARTGTNETPRLWQGEELQELLSNPHRRDNGVLDLVAQSTGRELLNDEFVWPSLRGSLSRSPPRFWPSCAGPAQPKWQSPYFFPEGIHFSSDGRFFSYVVPNVWPFLIVSAAVGDGTVVEDVRTGQRVALLPGVTHEVRISPGGRTAVSVNLSTKPEGEQPRLILWDLHTSKRRAELLLPETERRPVYSADGRYVFADYFLESRQTVDQRRSHDLRWWDTETGRRVGEVINVGERTLIDGGRVLVTHPTGSRDGGEGGCQILRFWNVASGAELGEWDLGDQPNGGGRIMDLVGSDGGRYLAAEYNPDYGEGRGESREIMDELVSNPSERRQILLLDVVERREGARLPGLSAKWSRDGRWLATIDGEGVVRVWEMPVGARTWGRPLEYATILTLFCWAAVTLMRLCCWGRAFAKRRNVVTPSNHSR